MKGKPNRPPTSETRNRVPTIINALTSGFIQRGLGKLSDYAKSKVIFPSVIIGKQGLFDVSVEKG